MRQIKFRGFDSADGVRRIISFSLDDLLASADDFELVDPQSVRQFIATDKNGRDVYEDDLVLRVLDFDSNGQLVPAKCWPRRASFDDFVAIRDGLIILCKEAD